MKIVVRRSFMIMPIIICILCINFLTTKAAFANTGVPYIGPGRVNSTEGVKCIQQALGLNLVDGQFGQQTYDAVKGFQEAHGLMVDGIVGPDTGDHLIGSTPNPYYCSKFVPTSYMVMDDSGNLAQGGQVVDPSQVKDPGAVPVGGSVKECLVKGLGLSSPGSIIKVIWKHKFELDPYVAGIDIASCILVGTP